MTKQRYLAALVARVRYYLYMQIAFAPPTDGNVSFQLNKRIGNNVAFSLTDITMYL